MLRLRVGLVSAAALVALAGASARAHAHPITIDGDAAEWLTRAPNAENIGIVARNAQGHGEWIWLDASGDTRTDLATPEIVADIMAFQVTADPTGVYFLVRRPPGAVAAGQPIQVQIAIDLDRQSGSGQEYFGAFGDTKVSDAARWERLVVTRFGSNDAAQVLDAGFNQVSVSPAVQGPSGDIEIGVSWSALGLNGPPELPLRLTVTTYRAKADDLTVDIGGPGLSNALDAITLYGDPAAANHPNTFAEVSDQIVDHFADVWISPTGEVYAPLVVRRFVANAPGGGSDEWFVVQNVTPVPLSLDGFKLGDEETPDGTEGMFSFPAGATLAPGGFYVVARSATSYQAFFGAPPDAELPPDTSAGVPDMAPYAAWSSAANPNLQLANAGDELLVLDPSATLLDVVVFGNGSYPGVTAYTPAPLADHVLSRNAASADTDDCQVDFTDSGAQCASDAQCGGGACTGCFQNACGPKPQGTSCADANVCNGAEICDANGMCQSGMPLDCDDGNACTTDVCDPDQGCAHLTQVDGTACGDAQCNGTCQLGQCVCSGGAGGSGGMGSGGSASGGAGGASSGVGGEGGGSAGGAGGMGSGGASGGGGTGGSATGPSSTSSGSGPSTGAGAPGGKTGHGFEDDSGCDCRAAPGASSDRGDDESGALAWLGTTLGLVAWRRRRADSIRSARGHAFHRRAAGGHARGARGVHAVGGAVAAALAVEAVPKGALPVVRARDADLDPAGRQAKPDALAGDLPHRGALVAEGAAAPVLARIDARVAGHPVGREERGAICGRRIGDDE